MRREWVDAFEQVKMKVEGFAEKAQPFYEKHYWKLYNHKAHQLQVPSVDDLIELINRNLDALEEHAADENFGGFSEVQSGCISVRATNYPQVGPQISVELIAEDLWSYGEPEVKAGPTLN